MSESFDVVTGDLTAHASTLDDLSVQLSAALDTARRVDLTPDAFGEIGQNAVPDVQSVATTGQDALRTQVAALQTASTDMRATANAYQQQDVDTGTKLSSIGDGLPPQTTATAPQMTTDTPVTAGDQVFAQNYSAPAQPTATAAPTVSAGDAGPAPIPAQGTKPGEVAGWWGSLNQEQKQQITTQNPQQIGALDGVPAAVRDYANRQILPDLKDQTQAQLAELNYQQPRYDASNPGAVDATTGVNDAQVKYSNEFLAWNQQVNDTKAKLGGLEAIQNVIGPNQTSFPNDLQPSVNNPDGSPQKYLMGVDTNDMGHAIIASNNPDTAHNVVTMVPGMNTRVDAENVNWYTQRMDNLVGAATNNSSTSAIAWMNYNAPQAPEGQWWNGAGSAAAQNGAPGLIQFQQGLDATHGSADSLMTWLPHSYGTDVVGQAATMTPGGLGNLGVTNVVVVGSPGMDVSKASDLGVQNVWATEATNDSIKMTPPFHGPSPVGPSFGAQVFDSGQGAPNMFPDYRVAHSSYFDTNSPALANMGNIITGNYNQVTKPPPPWIPADVAIPP